jgi:diguanylate cyclase (GGDEF)-like protein
MADAKAGGHDRRGAPGRLVLLGVGDRAETFEEVADAVGEAFHVRAVTVAEAPGAIEALEGELLLIDAGGGLGEALSLLAWARSRRPFTAGVLLAGCDQAERSAGAVAAGLADACVLWPVRRDDLLPSLEAARSAGAWRRRHRPIREELTRTDERLHRAAHERERLLRRYADALEHRVRALEEEARRLRQRALSLESQGLTDALTGLPNRRAIEAAAGREVARRARHPAPLALGLIDADHFKQVNTDHLLSGGDRALVGLARAARAAIRETDSLGRVGGEEFLLVCPMTDAAGAEALAERVRAAVEREPIRYDGKAIALTVSVGMAVAPAGQPADLAALRHVAAQCLAEAKKAGRNRCVVRELSGMGGA